MAELAEQADQDEPERIAAGAARLGENVGGDGGLVSHHNHVLLPATGDRPKKQKRQVEARAN